ncbi:hypothetical protein DYB25_012741, partial [Aphanomyces astaci]
MVVEEHGFECLLFVNVGGVRTRCDSHVPHNGAIRVVAQRLERVKQLGTGRVPGRVEIKNLLQLSHRWLVVTNEGPREVPYFGRTRGSEVLRLLHRRDDGARLPTVAKRWCLARRAAATAAARRIATVSPNERGTDDGLRDDVGGDDGDYDDNAEIKDADDNQAPQRLGDTDSSDDDVEDNAPQPKRAKTTSTHINFGNIVLRRYDPGRNIPIETYLRDFDRVTRTYAAVNGARWTDEALGAFLPGWADADYGGAALKQHLRDQYSHTIIETIDDIRVAICFQNAK